MTAYLESLLHTYGYAAVFTIIALENAGLPLPGETILITSAIVAATTGGMNVVAIVVTAALAAFSGSIVGFSIGRYGERHLLHRYAHHLHIDERDLRLGRYLFQRYGGRVVLVARFVAFLREVDSLLAGINRMGWKRFLACSGAGAAAWSATFGFGAYALGERIEALSTRATVLIGAIVLLLAIAGFRFLRRNRKRLQQEADQFGAVK